MTEYINVLYKKTARIMIAVCGLLFSLFSFVYLYVFQRDVLEALHFSLAHGKTVFAPLASAIVITLILLLLRWGVNSLLGLKGKVRALAYVPSFLVLCALTDVGRGVYMSSYHTPWTWLLPLLVLLFVGLGYWLRGLFRVQLNQEGSIWGLVNSNLTILLGLCVLTVCVGNTNRGYHHELEAEHYLRAQEYDKVLQVGKHSLEASRTLTVFRAVALSHLGQMGDKLFAYPQYYRSDGLFFDADSLHTLRYTNDSIYYLLGARPYAGEDRLVFCGTSATRVLESIHPWIIIFRLCCWKSNWIASCRRFRIFICQRILCHVIIAKRLYCIMHNGMTLFLYPTV